MVRWWTSAPTEPPPGILRLARDITRNILDRGRVDLDDPNLYRRFYADLYDLSATDKKGLGGLRAGLGSDFPEIARRYRLIENDHLMPVVVPWPGLPEKTLNAITRLQRGFADEVSFRRIRRATVNVDRTIALDWAAQKIIRLTEPYPLPILDLPTWPSLYHPRFGLDCISSPTLAPEDLII